VSKADARVAAYGDVDELNATIGLARTEPLGDDVDTLLQTIQSRLFDVGAELATMPEKKDKLSLPTISEDDVVALERAIDRAEEELTPLATFILPGGTRGAACLHVARTVCRRAERHICALAAGEPVRDEILRYVNRLSDLLFVLARLANAREGVSDVPWAGSRGA
jgi:cob(I)alamin adenosyltransferase